MNNTLNVNKMVMKKAKGMSSDVKAYSADTNEEMMPQEMYETSEKEETYSSPKEKGISKGLSIGADKLKASDVKTGFENKSPESISKDTENVKAKIRLLKKFK